MKIRVLAECVGLVERTNVSRETFGFAASAILSTLQRSVVPAVSAACVTRVTTVAPVACVACVARVATAAPARLLCLLRNFLWEGKLCVLFLGM